MKGSHIFTLNHAFAVNDDYIASHRGMHWRKRAQHIWALTIPLGITIASLYGAPLISLYGTGPSKVIGPRECHAGIA